MVKCQLDRDDGRTIYEVELRNGRMEYDCDIDAVSGQILKWERLRRLSAGTGKTIKGGGPAGPPP